MIIFDNKNKVYTINEVAELAKIHPQTLRNWEKNQLLAPQRISGNQRIYTCNDLISIEKIMDLKNEGYNIKAIKHIIETEC